MTRTFNERCKPGVRWIALPGERREPVGPFDAASLSGQKVALHGTSRSVAGWLLELDGVAEQIVLVPQESCVRACERIVSDTGVEVVLTDSDELAARWPGSRARVYRPETAPGSAQLVPVERLTQTRWVLSTSGTTSTPKRVAHTLASLARTVARSPRSTNYRWGLLYDVTRFAGLQVLLQGSIAGQAVIFRDGWSQLTDQLAWFSANGCNALSATPTLWRKILMTAGSEELQLRQITLGGEIVDQGLLDVLRGTYPTAHITHVYASTEAGVAFAIHDERAGFPARFLEDGVGGENLQIGTDGCLRILCPEKTQEYVGGPSLYEDGAGWINTGDVVERAGDRVLFKGRLNGSINVGGNKVLPEEVENVILQMPEIAAVAVRGLKSSLAGSLVEAVVVLKPGTQTEGMVGRIKAFCRLRMAAFKVPAVVRTVDSLDATGAGKISRIES